MISLDKENYSGDAGSYRVGCDTAVSILLLIDTAADLLRLN